MRQRLAVSDDVTCFRCPPKFGVTAAETDILPKVSWLLSAETESKLKVLKSTLSATKPKPKFRWTLLITLIINCWEREKLTISNLKFLNLKIQSLAHKQCHICITAPVNPFYLETGYNAMHGISKAFLSVYLSVLLSVKCVDYHKMKETVPTFLYNMKHSSVFAKNYMFNLLACVIHKIIRIPVLHQASAPGFDTVLRCLCPSKRVNPQCWNSPNHHTEILIVTIYYTLTHAQRDIYTVTPKTAHFLIGSNFDNNPSLLIPFGT